MLAIADAAEIAAVLDCRGAFELRGPEFLFYVPVRTVICRWAAERALQGCDRSIDGTFA
jgi:hypothetical protein